ncbi:MAG TPA: DNA adenine methylase [Candidatus Coprovicinus avistercoris]|uniref:site-specific DNA-methyltransferase (adenine-specific) n=1 Tax=Candidatus Coprovicinus avistercoris TaxID=2840754 RepID=A0A9D1HVK7_9ACTN|nr:DNA adenine methylase [Candidatus Coprovicinus avistercoris]
MPITYTPMRFPGGKSKIYPLVDRIISDNELDNCVYGEAFCGGAGLAIKLLIKNRVSKIVLNDADPAIYSIWNSILCHAENLCDFVANVPLTIDEWNVQHEIYATKTTPSLELGKAAFFLNRTNRSGMLEGGVIGGHDQTGKYKIDARFNRENLIQKIKTISKLASKIELYNLDVSEFLINVANDFPENSLLYLDPPYVAKGPGLYKSSFDSIKHRSLAEEIKVYRGNWMLTYDDDPLIRNLYEPNSSWPISVGNVSVGYSAATIRIKATEFLALSPGLTLPKSTNDAAEVKKSA